MTSLPVAGGTLDHPPHPLAGSNPLHEVGREESDPVAALPLRAGTESGALNGRRGADCAAADLFLALQSPLVAAN